jgi:predicted enzyme related to lactoylglutathione lyase
MHLPPCARFSHGARFNKNNIASMRVGLDVVSDSKFSKFTITTMEKGQTLRGMATVNFWADDIKEARKWYNELLNIEPYFERPDSANPSYLEYSFGDFQAELGIIDRKFAPQGTSRGTCGAVLFWHVDDVEGTLKRLLSMGCKEYEKLTPREEGFITASVIDPFGNILGVMHNPHYLEIVKSKKPETADLRV